MLYHSFMLETLLQLDWQLHPVVLFFCRAGIWVFSRFALMLIIFPRFWCMRSNLICQDGPLCYFKLTLWWHFKQAFQVESLLAYQLQQLLELQFWHFVYMLGFLEGRRLWRNHFFLQRLKTSVFNRDMVILLVWWPISWLFGKCHELQNIFLVYAFCLSFHALIFILHIYYLNWWAFWIWKKGYS